MKTSMMQKRKAGEFLDSTRTKPPFIKTAKRPGGVWGRRGRAACGCQAWPTKDRIAEKRRLRRRKKTNLCKDQRRREGAGCIRAAGRRAQGKMTPAEIIWVGTGMKKQWSKKGEKAIGPTAHDAARIVGRKPEVSRFRLRLSLAYELAHYASKEGGGPRT